MTACPAHLDPATFAFYGRSLTALNDAGVPYLVGGAYAFERYTGIARHTKDFDIFVRPADLDATLAILGATGCDTEITFPHWLAKARCGEHLVDIIFSSGNGIAEVDELWYEHAVDDTVLGVPVRLMPAEEMIWSKGFIMERERYDGADIIHIIQARAESLDWPRVLLRFGRHWRVLFSHLVLFGFVYPAERTRIPAWVMQELGRRLARESVSVPVTGATPVCRGPLLSRAQYLVDIEERGYRDARLTHESAMSSSDIELWTEGIKVDGEDPLGGGSAPFRRSSAA
ncbi:MAG TPA: hypothetical protein VGQ77_03740 [Methylomirabilota bacterium]|jgi:hypothetical protein|nr:hypothetical protein [Methylomirabilota bacterium]